MISTTSFVAAGINQTKGSLDWNKKNNVIAYAAANRILLYDPSIQCVIGASLEKCCCSINCVQWVRNGYESVKGLILLSLSNGAVKLWKYKHLDSCHPKMLRELDLIINIEGKFGCLFSGFASFYKSLKVLNKENLLVIATGDNHNIIGWDVDLQTGNAEEMFVYNLPKRSLALDVTMIPLSTITEFTCFPLIMYGGDDGKIHLLTSADGLHYNHSGLLAGHLDWVMTLEYTVDDNDILLSSGSKDGIIRLWRFSTQKPKCHIYSDDLQVKCFELDIPIFQDTNKDCSDSFKLVDQKYLRLFCSLESVLHGHEGLVTHLDWSPNTTGKSLQLLSCSKTDDRSVIVWQSENESSDTDEEIWVEKTRLGEVGGNREGFLNAVFGPSNDKVAATSYQGGLHLWHLVNDTWVPQPVVSGHFNDVMDLDWDVHGHYLLSTSKDQTTRLYAPIHMQDGTEHWQEIARPQVHGYDMSSIVCLDKYKFVSGAEEKVIRGFTATLAFIKSLVLVTNTDVDTDIASYKLPDSASVPSLGLSNKADDFTNENGKVNDTFSTVNGVENIGLPTEDKLMLGTLWPEISKLYGHGNEILSLAATSDGKLLASSCRANNEVDAKVIIWNTDEWKEIQNLSQNRLSVTQMSFSPCDKYLLCVSRDRSWVVYARNENSFAVKFHSGKLGKSLQHSRIIWSCCWIPNSLKFVTGSRDKTVVVWKPTWDAESKTILNWEREATSTEPDEVTAVATSFFKHSNNILIAVGTTSGKLILRTYNNSAGIFAEYHDVKITHVNTIRRLKFNPVNKGKNVTLASCGSDNAVILYNITEDI